MEKTHPGRRRALRIAHFVIAHVQTRGRRCSRSIQRRGKHARMRLRRADLARDDHRAEKTP